jgi:hypothetical protein
VCGLCCGVRFGSRAIECTVGFGRLTKRAPTHTTVPPKPGRRAPRRLARGRLRGRAPLGARGLQSSRPRSFSQVLQKPSVLRQHKPPTGLQSDPIMVSQISNPLPITANPYRLPLPTPSCRPLLEVLICRDPLPSAECRPLTPYNYNLPTPRPSADSPAAIALPTLSM